MLFKLLLPTHHRLMSGAAIVQWHRAPGQLVDYGDDLLDIRIEEGMTTQGWSENNVRALIRAQMAMIDVTDDELMLDKRQPAELTRVTANAVIRISSSDRGWLRQIRVGQGERCKMGTCLAVLTSEQNESAEDTDDTLAGASPFRVAPALLDPARDGV